MNRLILLTGLLILGACTQYSLVKPTTIEVKGITVSPTIPWNSASSAAGVGGKPTWTADGTKLNSVVFFPAVKDGKSLFKSTKKEEYPAFSADMLPNEIAELVESSISKIFKATISKKGTLKPLVIDGNPGFQYNFEFVTQDDIPRRAFVAGATKNSELYLMFYQATRMYYYEKYIDEIKNMASTMRLN